MKPLGQRVLLRRVPVGEKIGSIIIPDSARAIPQEATVVATGRSAPCAQCGHENEPPVKVGETVLHGRFSRMGLPREYGEDLYLVWAGDIMVVLEP